MLQKDMLQKDISILQNPGAALQCEWLETNGLGGWSSSTIIGCHTRRYHGLLVAATLPPAERMSLLSKMDETVITAGRQFELGTNDYGDAVHPQGYQYMTGFTKDLFPVFFYKAGGIELTKTICMVHGENTVIIIYNVISADAPFTLALLPLLSVRNYHSLQHANQSVNQQGSFNNSVFSIKSYPGTPDIFIKVPGAAWHPDPKWFYHFHYSVEQYRGLDFTEDLFAPGTFHANLKKGDSLGIVISTEDPGNTNAFDALQQEEKRKKELLKAVADNEMIQQLTLAADQFIVKRTIASASPNREMIAGATVIAGYHWFTDWGRDTMIALPGLTLSTGRLEDAKKILTAFAQHVSMGMLPNRFPDNGEPPEYNNVDATLWYFIAVYKYLRASNDKNFVLQNILPVLKDIISWHYKGTRYNIHVEDDGLLYAGEAGQQLTWMDAKVDNWVVTPRMGKPVEIQALWYNTQKIFSALLQLNNQPDEAAVAAAHAEKTKQSFTEKFWYAAGNYLYDTIDENGIPDARLRPNQLFAISLPFALIGGEQAVAVTQIVEKQLYTTVGLKSLAATDEQYVPLYGGDRYHRDAAYHQGTVWSWLLGPYVDAIMTMPYHAGLNGLKGKEKARNIIENFRYHLSEACIGSVSEIFDAAAPHHPRGCIAQAWGVAEILRVIKDYQLY